VRLCIILVRAGEEWWIRDLPLLGAVPALQERDRDEDDDSLPAVSDLNL